MPAPKPAALVIALVSAALCGAITYARMTALGFPGDTSFAQEAAAHLLAGRDPYAVMPEGTMLYPLPAAVVMIPTVGVAVRALGAGFVALATFLLAYALARRAWWALLALLSPSFLLSVWAVQWPPMIVAAAMFPALGWLGVVKPNLGLAGFVYRPQWSTALGAAALLAVSFALVPTWPLGWFRHLGAQETAHLPAVLWPGGVLGLVGLLRWRLPEGRVLAAMTLIPATSVGYDYLMLWLVPRTAREMLTLTATSWLAVLAIYATAPNDLTRPWTLAHLFTACGVIVPCAAIVWRRTHERTEPVTLHADPRLHAPQS